MAAPEPVHRSGKRAEISSYADLDLGLCELERCNTRRLRRSNHGCSNSGWQKGMTCPSRRRRDGRSDPARLWRRRGGPVSPDHRGAGSTPRVCLAIAAVFGAPPVLATARPRVVGLKRQEIEGSKARLAADLAGINAALPSSSEIPLNLFAHPLMDEVAYSEGMTIICGVSTCIAGLW